MTTDVIAEMFKRGAHFGYSRARRHPSVKPYIFGYKNRSAVINLEKTAEMLESAKTWLKELAASGGVILLVGTKPEARVAIAESAKKLGLPYKASRWIGGTLTNFSQIRKRLDRLAELTAQREVGEFEGRTKREKALSAKELVDLENLFGGLEKLEKLPQAMLAIDPAAEAIAVAEAIRLRIPVVALASSDCDISKVAYPVVANDANQTSIGFFVEELMTAYGQGRTN